MKRKFIIAGALMLGGCLTQKEPVVTYEFPTEMREDVKKSYTEMWHKGKVLYNLNCASCHNRVEKRKVIIPEFTEEMLAAYEVRVADPQHEMAVSDTKVNTEELALITLFLTYRKHDSAALKQLMAQPRNHEHQGS